MENSILFYHAKRLVEDYERYTQQESVGNGITSLMHQFQSSMSLYEQIMKFIDEHPDDGELKELKEMIACEVRTSDDLYDLIQVAEFLNDIDDDCRGIKNTIEKE
jgi:hypothetical protein